jgi:hypothetical protein
MNDPHAHGIGTSRRSFLKTATSAVVTLAGATAAAAAAGRSAAGSGPEIDTPWYRRVTRWGQINITEDNAANFDIAWWRKYWKQTETQGIVLNAGGVVAYYPSKVPFHRRAASLGDRDLFGELCRAAHEDGVVVFARMDSGKAHEEVYKAHPDWFAVDHDGKPYLYQNEFFVTCINGPYYREHIPAILREIAATYKPEGVTDNNWEGLGRKSPCYCGNCQRLFRDRTGNAIPRSANWDDPVYLEWIAWNNARRLEQWDFNNRITRAAGGPQCAWTGMISSSISGQTDGFCDLKEICDRADIIMIDAQSRSNAGGFQENSDTGKRIHGLVGWDKIVAESLAMYVFGSPIHFRLASAATHEARMWMLEGIAGGIAPWWHYISGYHEDSRIYRPVEPTYRWHKANEEFLFNRNPVATVGVVWSEENTKFYGRDEASLLVDLPTRGITQALGRARIPYISVNANHIDRDAGQLSLLVLPNVGVLTDAQAASVRRFVEGGGGLIATGETSLYDKAGARRADYALGDLFGAHPGTPRDSGSTSTLRSWANQTHHTYLRLTPELRRNADSPKNGLEPVVRGERHPVLDGFAETDILPFGGVLEPCRVDAGAQVLMTFVPPFPTHPPEMAWMREPKTDIPGLVLNTTAKGGRVAFLPADLDRQFARSNFPDHGNLLASLARWASKNDIPLAVQGAGLVDCNMYRQPGRLILHMTNLTSAGTWRKPMDELTPIGPLSLRVKLTNDVKGEYLNLLVVGQKIPAVVRNGWSHFQIQSIADHEVVVIT